MPLGVLRVVKPSLELRKEVGLKIQFYESILVS